MPLGCTFCARVMRDGMSDQVSDRMSDRMSDQMSDQMRSSPVVPLSTATAGVSGERPEETRVATRLGSVERPM